MLDPGASAAFAVADHQVAHIYVNDPARLSDVRRIIEGVPGVEAVLGAAEKAKYHIAHERAGDLIAIARPDAWFTYYQTTWEEDGPVLITKEKGLIENDRITSVDVHAVILRHLDPGSVGAEFTRGVSP
jgi:hypothetical protein